MSLTDGTIPFELCSTKFYDTNVSSVALCSGWWSVELDSPRAIQRLSFRLFDGVLDPATFQLEALTEDEDSSWVTIFKAVEETGDSLPQLFVCLSLNGMIDIFVPGLRLNS